MKNKFKGCVSFTNSYKVEDKLLEIFEGNPVPRDLKNLDFNPQK